MPTAPVAPARQLDYSRPLTRGGSIGFACLTIGLAAMTFVVTIWGMEFPPVLMAAESIAADPTAVISREFLPAAEAEVIYEPKTEARLPVFGGMVPVGR